MFCASEDVFVDCCFEGRGTDLLLGRLEVEIDTALTTLKSNALSSTSSASELSFSSSSSSVLHAVLGSPLDCDPLWSLKRRFAGDDGAEDATSLLLDSPDGSDGSLGKSGCSELPPLLVLLVLAMAPPFTFVFELRTAFAGVVGRSRCPPIAERPAAASAGPNLSEPDNQRSVMRQRSPPPQKHDKAKSYSVHMVTSLCRQRWLLLLTQGSKLQESWDLCRKIEPAKLQTGRNAPSAAQASLVSMSV